MSRQYCSQTNLLNSENNNENKIGSIYNQPDIKDVIEIIKHKFYFATLIPGKKIPKNVSDVYYFDTDTEFIYQNFFNDFGPLNIACLYKYCCGINEILSYDFHRFVHYTSPDEKKRANAAFLVASFAVLYLGKNPEDVYKWFTNKNLPSLKPFQDASPSSSYYKIKLIDCLHALIKAATLGFFNLEDFDVIEYERYEKMRHGDLTWIIPQKFIAFLGPNTGSECISHDPEKYINYFLKNDIKAVIRLNKITYESFRFTDVGIQHYDMFFPDGTVPPQDILKEFLEVAESTKGAIAVHCKAGLGRTGTLIAAYLIKHYRMRAKEAIAWLRICRPGSVIGHQQAWLEDMEWMLWREGRRFRNRYYGDDNFILHHSRGIYSKARKHGKKNNSVDCITKENKNKIKKNELKIPSDATSLDSIVEYVPLHETMVHTGNSEHSIYRQLKIENCNKAQTQGDESNDIKIRRKKKVNTMMN